MLRRSTATSPERRAVFRISRMASNVSRSVGDRPDPRAHPRCAVRGRPGSCVSSNEMRARPSGRGHQVDAAPPLQRAARVDDDDRAPAEGRELGGCVTAPHVGLGDADDGPAQSLSRAVSASMVSTGSVSVTGRDGPENLRGGLVAARRMSSCVPCRVGGQIARIRPAGRRINFSVKNGLSHELRRDK